MKLRLLVAAGALAVVASTTAIAAIAADPFDQARYYIGTKDNADALRLIDSGQFDVNMQTDEGYSLLHYAAGAGNLEMVKALLQRGADPTLKANMGYTPYQMAIGTMVKAEIRKAMSAGTRRPAADEAAAAADAPARSEGTPGSNGMCELARNDPANNGRSPAERPFLQAKDAIWYNHPDELTGLLEDCVGVNDKDRYGSTLLHIAADRDRVALAKILLDHGAKRNILDKDGKTAAAYAQSPEMKALLGPAPKAAAAKSGAATTASASRKKECEQKFQADAALASDSTGKARSYRRWQQCLKTGLYW